MSALRGKYVFEKRTQTKSVIFWENIKFVDILGNLCDINCILLNEPCSGYSCLVFGRSERFCRFLLEGEILEINNHLSGWSETLHACSGCVLVCVLWNRVAASLNLHICLSTYVKIHIYIHLGF